MGSSFGHNEISSRLLGLSLTLIVVAAFGLSLFGGFVFDDRFIIVDNAYLANPSDWSRFFTESSWAGNGGDASNYRALPLLSFGLNYLMGGLRPFGFHLVNLVFHITNVLLLFALAQRLGLSKSSSWLASALFAVHPLQTEPVAGIVGRMDLMAATGLLAALLCHLNGRASAEKRSRRIWFIGAALCYALALWSKEHVILFPAVAVAADILLTKKARKQEYWPYVAYTIVGAVYLAVWFSIFPLDSLPSSATSALSNPLASASGPLRFVSAIGVGGIYLVHFIWPVNLSPDYCSRQILPLDSLASSKAFVTLVGAGLIVLMGVFWGRHNRVGAVALTLAFLMFLPVSNLLFPIGTVMGDRLFYLPVAGFSLAVGTLMDRTAARSGKSRFSAVWLVLIALLTGLSIRQSLVWRTNYTVDQQVVEAAPRCARGHNNLGYDLLDRGEVDDAEHSFLTALELFSPYPQAQAGLARVAYSRHDWMGALDHAEEVLFVAPEYSAMMHMAAQAALQSGDREKAEHHWRRALGLDPTDAEAMSNLAVLAWGRGEPREAIALWSRAVNEPDVRPTVLFNLARAHDDLNEAVEALSYYRLFLQRDDLEGVDPATVSLAEERVVELQGLPQAEQVPRRDG